MRILIIANKFPYPSHDGGALATASMLEGLVNAEQDIYLYTMTTPKHPANENNLPERLMNKITAETCYVDTNIDAKDMIVNFLFKRTPYIAERFYSDTFNNRLVQILEKNKFDIIQLEGLYLLHLIPLIREHSSAKIVYRAHNIEHYIWKRKAKNEINPIKKFYFYNLSKRLHHYLKKHLNTYDGIISISEPDFRIHKWIGQQKPEIVLPVGLDLSDYFSYPITTNAIEQIAFIGGLDWLPNQEGLEWFLTKVWNKILYYHPKAELHIAGRNCNVNLEKIISSTKNTKFYGEVTSSKDFLSAHSILIVPLFSGSGIRVKIIEGMAMGKAIVTTSIGAEGIPIENKKNAIIADTVEDFADAINLLINNPDMIYPMGNNARDLVKRYFSLEKLTKDLLNFYKTLV
jgi:glycosyltransferase involved in cell wall biosynthesis